MVNTKVNLTILLQGGTMLSERDCSKEVNRPVINKKGKYAGKQKKDKDGNLIFETVLVPDLDKLDHHTIKVSYRDDSTKKLITEHIGFSTRKCKPATQTLNICEEAYEYMTGNEVPEGFRYPRNFNPNKTLLRKGIPAVVQAWNAQSEKQKLEWHLHRICGSVNGTLSDYTVFND